MRISICFATLVAMLICTSDAYAYIDPGTGSMIIQLIIATVVGAIVYFRRYLLKITSFFKKSSKDNDDK